MRASFQYRYPIFNVHDVDFLAQERMDARRSLGLLPVKHTKGTIYVDDDLELDFNKTSTTAEKMKSIMLFELDRMNVKTDLKPGPVKKTTKYLGWTMSLEERGIRLPGDKKRRILDKLDNLRTGRKNIKTNAMKKVPYLFNSAEISSVAGSLVHFCVTHNTLVPFLTPFYRLLDPFKYRPKAFLRLNILDNKSLMHSVKIMREAVHVNKWIPFHQVAKSYGTVRDTFVTYADAAGESSIFNPEAFGMGGLCYDLNFAWQCPRRIFVPFLRSAIDTQTIKDSIASEELLAQQLNKFLLGKFRPKEMKRNCLWCVGDNAPVQV